MDILELGALIVGAIALYTLAAVWVTTHKPSRQVVVKVTEMPPEDFIGYVPQGHIPFLEDGVGIINIYSSKEKLLADMPNARPIAVYAQK